MSTHLFFSICSYVFWGLAVVIFIKRSTDESNVLPIDMMLVSFAIIGTICYIMRIFCH